MKWLNWNSIKKKNEKWRKKKHLCFFFFYFYCKVLAQAQANITTQTQQFAIEKSKYLTDKKK